ncbi:hypothetical protein KTN05_13625 [Paracoccus sp. Z118]|uniref:hypothetical protein n=1 Tax=Paracoccus sp. Z118 TaxID=2851017 RepID=UPI001C2C0DD5|nr:hypothetical protein [Paracoccus sp. Z118]MBV0892882.1 hypothetical protein [Paracoccus sp. Z118]
MKGDAVTKPAELTDDEVAYLILQNCYDLGVGHGAAQAMVERSLQHRRKLRDANALAKQAL